MNSTTNGRISQPLTESDLIFPSAATSFSQAVRQTKKSTLSISNRLHSIARDSQFVEQIANTYNLPLAANERCGSWYIPPHLKAASVYFKSTDGHFGQWAFSLRRLNLHVLPIIASAGGCMIVDSTRRGKYAPDALAKTIPVWCATINRLLFGEDYPVHTDPMVVSESERSQIEARMSHFVQQAQNLKLEVDSLRQVLKKPLLPVLLIHGQDTSHHNAKVEDLLDSHYPLYLVVASRYCPDGSQESIEGYVQGAGDDSEGWACGLTPECYWKHHDALLSTSESDLPDRIASLLGDMNHTQQPICSVIRPTSSVFVSSLGSAPLLQEAFDCAVICGNGSGVELPSVSPSRILHLICERGKLGSRDLRKQLPKLPAFLERLEVSSVLLCCSSGRDLSLGVALSILCKYTDDQGVFRTQGPRPSIDKSTVKQKLSWIMTSIPDAKPSRATLTAVNSFLMQQVP